MPTHKHKASDNRVSSPGTGVNQRDAIQEFAEWQDHQYDPGYWTGGRIPPYLLGKRPNKMGYVLIAIALFTLMVAIFVTLTNIQNGSLSFESDATIIGSLVLMYGLVVLMLVSGASLVRKREDKK